MAIERIAILGTGLLGTSVGLALRESGFKGTITGGIEIRNSYKSHWSAARLVNLRATRCSLQKLPT